MLPLVALVKTDVSEEHMASIIRVTRFGELGIVLMPVLTRTSWHNISEDGILQKLYWLLF
jgi:hypothetical protein